MTDQKGRPTKSITIRGVTYKSIDEAAYVLGVHPETIYRARRTGRLHEVGKPNKGRKVPVFWDGKEYPSIAEASRATGATYGQIRWYMDSLRGKTYT